MKIFLSHSTKDSKLATRIAEDLRRNSIDVWFDEWEIFVGDSIISKVQEGLNSCDFLGVLFTKNSLKSSWVEKEWQSILYKETNKKEIILLPIKGDNCEMPFIVGDKLYADISKDYEIGVKKLIETIHHHKKNKTKGNENPLKKKNKVNEIELKLSNIDLDNFSERDKEKVAKAISELIGGSFDIKIIGVRKGSVIIKFKLPNDKTTSRFFKKFKNMKSDLVADDAWLVDKTPTTSENGKSHLYDIEGTHKTPTIYLNAMTGKGAIKGRSIPENSTEFYKPVIDWIESHLINSASKNFILDIQIEYFNTSSAKCLLDIFKKLETAHKTGTDICVNWYYEKDDEDMLEAGEDYASIVNIPIKMVEMD